MGNTNLVTGYRGEEHVTSTDAKALNAGLFGKSNYVFRDLGEEFACVMDTTTQATVFSGDGIMQGAHFRLPYGDTVQLTIESGVSGYNRNDLIVARYTKDLLTAVEEVNLVVIQGEISSSTPTDPSYSTGDIIDGNATQVDFPLWRIPVRALTVNEPERLFTITSGSLDSIYPIGAIYTSTVSTSPAELFGGTWARIKDKFLMSAGTTYTAGSTGGSATKTITTANMPAHTHGLNNHTHSFSASGTTGASTIISSNYVLPAASDWSSQTLSSSTGIAYHVPYTDTLTTTQGSHSHTFTMSGTTGGNSGNTTSTGSGTAINIMPPYQAVYVWERTA